MKISTETAILDALNASPAVSAVFEKHNIQCSCCGGAVAETLAICARTHGLEPEALVAEVQQAIESSPHSNGK